MKIYRYRRPTKYLENEILLGEIFFSPVNSMNDFYDSFYRHSEEGDIEKHIEMLREKSFDHAREIIEKGPDYTDEVQSNMEKRTGKSLFQWAYNILNDPTYIERSIAQLRIDFKNNPERIKETTRVQNINADVIRSKMSICCLSKKKLCLSMFGYYGDDGKGVMFEYENLENKAREVKYVDTLPIRKIDTPFLEGMEMQVYNKLNCWSHEEEMRISAYNKGGTHTDHGLKMTGIYLGPRIVEENSNNVIKWANKASLPVYKHSEGENGVFDWELIR